MTRPELTVFHDSSCPLCRLEIGHYRKQAGAERIEFVDVSDPDVHPGPGLAREDAMRRFHVRLPNGDLRSGTSAFIEIWKVLPRWQPLGRVASLPGLSGALDFGYTLVSPLRPVLARIVSHFYRD